MAFKCLVPPGFSIYEFRAKAFDLVQNLLPGRVDSTFKRGIDGANGSAKRFQFPHDSISTTVKNFGALKALHCLTFEELPPSQNIGQIHVVLAKHAHDS